jgi:Xaa-Pro aminopeptidase
LTVSEKLLEIRKEEDVDASSAPALATKKFMSLSFGTICGYNEHGAIVHYAVTPETAKTLKSEGLLLLDSGAQYTDGTTDITRTIALGRLTPEMRRVYTLVLKAHIALASISFPEGTNGTNLDTIPHSVLWRGKVDYMHGSGHGVGSCLSVHEGPQSMRQRWCPAPLQEGMTLTIEPGVYLEGKFGVRVENTMLVKRDNSVNGEKKWLTFEPLTLCPIDTTPIEMDMMEQYEKDYLNDYHALVRAKLLPLLSNPDDKAWLIENTKKI